MKQMLLALVGSAALAATAFAEGPHFDRVFVGGKVIDGTGNPWQYGDVGIVGDRITFVGSLPAEYTADVTTDISGHVITPGFIDVHAHADDDLYEHPAATNFVRDGVTTIINGNCGGSVVDVAAYFEKLTTDGVGINVATLYGHNTILRNVKGDMAGDLTDEQMAKAKTMMEQAMSDGAVGMSTGLIYTPGEWSSTQEIVDLQKVAAEHGGIYVSHMRSESSGIVAAIEEALLVGREANSPVQISHFKIMSDAREKVGGSNVTLKMIDDARAAGQEVWLDQYPYNASSTSLSTTLPSWLKEEGRDAMTAMLADPAKVDEAVAEMHKRYVDERGRKDMSYVVIASCRAFPEFNGKTLLEAAQLVALRGDNEEMPTELPADAPDVSMDDQFRTALMIQENGGASCVFHSMDEEDVVNIMQHPLVAICSDSGVRAYQVGHPHPRGYGSNARVLGQYVRTQRVLGLEDAVRKMTSLPATAFRLNDRGRLAPGMVADIVVFNADTVTDVATFDDPHHYSTGFAWVLVNGTPVVENDQLLDAMPGKPVHGPGKK